MTESTGKVCNIRDYAVRFRFMLCGGSLPSMTLLFTTLRYQDITDSAGTLQAQ